MRTYTYLLSLFACLMLLASKSMAQPYTLRHLGIEDGLSNKDKRYVYVRMILDEF